MQAQVAALQHALHQQQQQQHAAHQQQQQQQQALSPTMSSGGLTPSGRSRVFISGGAGGGGGVVSKPQGAPAAQAGGHARMATSMPARPTGPAQLARTASASSGGAAVPAAAV
jgi:hypothetical protein